MEICENFQVKIPFGEVSSPQMNYNKSVLHGDWQGRSCQLVFDLLYYCLVGLIGGSGWAPGLLVGAPGFRLTHVQTYNP